MEFFGQFLCLWLIDAEVNGGCLSDPEAIAHRAGRPVIETWQVSRFTLYSSHQTLCWSDFTSHSVGDRRQKSGS